LASLALVDSASVFFRSRDGEFSSLIAARLFPRNARGYALQGRNSSPASAVGFGGYRGLGSLEQGEKEAMKQEKRGAWSRGYYILGCLLVPLVPGCSSDEPDITKPSTGGSGSMLGMGGTLDDHEALNTGGTSGAETSSGGGVEPGETGGSGGAPQAAGGIGGSGGVEASGGADDGTASGGAPSGCASPTPALVPIGYGRQATGGGNASPVVVSSFSAAQEALETYRDQFEEGTSQALVLHYTGTFNFSSITDVCAQHQKDAQILEVKEVDNVTILGLSGSSANFGIKINRAKNVVVRNMTLGLLPGGGDADAISIEGNGTNGDVEHVWIDHNELFSSTKDDCEGAGDTEFDGLIDVKKGARYITISYNYIHDHQKTGLLGHSDTDDVDRYVTFHHNWYQNVVSRTPLHRFGYVHLFNNYYEHILDSGINVRMGGVALIEANYFENAANPVTSRFSDEAGYWDLRNNLVGPGVTWDTTSDTLANADDWTSTATFPPSELTYSYTPDPAECVQSIVKASAGARL